MDMSVSVIVVKCIGERTYGAAIVDTRMATVDEARALAEPHCAEGICVIVRPNYNEGEGVARFFREWRSFHGKPLTEVRWDVPLL